jgi:hypothetical protein
MFKYEGHEDQRIRENQENQVWKDIERFESFCHELHLSVMQSP